MKTTTVPAQVTTVEDKIAGNLSLSQLLLLATPVFVSSLVYVIVPPFLKLTPLKIVLTLLAFTIFATSALRVRGKLLVEWVVLVMRYRLRPRYFLFNKNDAYLRNPATKDPQRTLNNENKEKTIIEHAPILTLPTPELVRLEAAMADPRANLMFRINRKGDLDVHITEIK